MGEVMVLSGPEGCYFGAGTGTKAVPPNIATTMIPAAANKFVLIATDVREPIVGRFIVPEDPGQKEVIVSGDYQYRRVSVRMKRAFEISTKTITVK